MRTSMAALIGLLVLIVVVGVSLAQQGAPAAPTASCEETLAAFRVMAERTHLSRAQAELQLAATENRLRAALEEIERLKAPKGDKK